MLGQSLTSRLSLRGFGWKIWPSNLQDQKFFFFFFLNSRWVDRGLNLSRLRLIEAPTIIGNISGLSFWAGPPYRLLYLLNILHTPFPFIMHCSSLVFSGVLGQNFRGTVTSRLPSFPTGKQHAALPQEQHEQKGGGRWIKCLWMMPCLLAAGFLVLPSSVFLAW